MVLVSPILGTDELCCVFVVCSDLTLEIPAGTSLMPCRSDHSTDCAAGDDKCEV